MKKYLKLLVKLNKKKKKKKKSARTSVNPLYTETRYNDKIR